MQAVLSMLLVIILALFTTTLGTPSWTCTGDDEINCTDVTLMSWEFEQPFFSQFSNNAGMKFFDDIMTEALSTAEIQTLCPKTQWSLQSLTDNQINVILWHNIAVPATCHDKLVAERTAMQTAVNLKFSIPKKIKVVAAPRVFAVKKPTHCFNGYKDSFEVDVDCGDDACGLTCRAGDSCNTSPDCITECFAGLCMIINSVPMHTAIYAIIGSVLSVAFFM